MGGHWRGVLERSEKEVPSDCSQEGQGNYKQEEQWVITGEEFLTEGPQVTVRSPRVIQGSQVNTRGAPK
jgi:hypothetical protein